MTNRFSVKRNRWFLLLLIYFSFVYAFICSDHAGAFEKPVAKINDTVLTETDLETALNEIMPAAIFHGGFSSKKRASHRPRALEKMIEKELFYQEAIRTGLKIDPELINNEIDKISKKFGGEKEYIDALKRAGLTKKQHKAKLTKKYMINKIIEIEIKKKAIVSSGEVKVYYNENKGRYLRPEARKLTHILVSVKPNATADERRLLKEDALKVIERIKAGEDMSVIAYNYSHGPYRVKGGDLGLVHKGRLDPELEEEVFKLEPGKISNIIETRFGYHIVRVEEVKAPEQLPFEEVSSKIIKELTREKEKQLREALLKKLRDQAKIEVYLKF
jgi:peptidyl-prolyl cis-trans isomerase C